MFEIELTIGITMDLAINNLQRLICHKTQPTYNSSTSQDGHKTNDPFLPDFQCKVKIKVKLNAIHSHYAYNSPILSVKFQEFLTTEIPAVHFYNKIIISIIKSSACIYIIHHDYHHVVALTARSSLTVSEHPSLSSIVPGRFSKLHPVSAQS